MNIYVGNLNYTVEEKNLSDIFGEYGTVETVKIIQDRISGRSKGFGFIEMLSEDEGKSAIDKLDQTEFMGRKLVVNEAKPRD